MLQKRSEMITKVALAVRQYPLLRKLCKPFSFIYKQCVLHPKAKKRNKVFRENALQVIDAFDKCLTSNGFEYTLAFGTMLGAVREHGFIKHDHDLDVAMWIDQYSPNLQKCLEQAGFVLYHEYIVDEGKSGFEQTYKYLGVAIDIFFIYPAIDEYPYCCDFVKIPGNKPFSHNSKTYKKVRARRLQLPWGKEFVRIPFQGLNLPVPSNAHEILSFRYGSDYMTPNPKWRYTDINKYTTIWKDKDAYVIK